MLLFSCFSSRRINKREERDWSRGEAIILAGNGDPIDLHPSSALHRHQESDYVSTTLGGARWSVCQGGWWSVCCPPAAGATVATDSRTTKVKAWCRKSDVISLPALLCLCPLEPMTGKGVFKQFRTRCMYLVNSKYRIILFHQQILTNCPEKKK